MDLPLSGFVHYSVTCRFKTFGRFETATAILIPLQGLEMAWPFEMANYSS